MKRVLNIILLACVSVVMLTTNVNAGQPSVTLGNVAVSVPGPGSVNHASAVGPAPRW